ncbi:MAG: endonuclease domain-containing protein [Deinococcota bacterium]|jgi:very-short-patch-repair endonuclease|nr:endonuclease domain-containing protein [Deinococcota bacterium]
MKRSPFHLPYNPALVPRAKELRRSMTAAEKRLWHGYLGKLNVRVLRQRPIDNFIVDFYCASAKLVIEVDGDSHYSPEAVVYDLERTRVLSGYGLRVVRFTNAEVLRDFGAVCERLGALLDCP